MLYFSRVVDVKMVSFISLLGKSLDLLTNLRGKIQHFFRTEEVIVNVLFVFKMILTFIIYGWPEKIYSVY